MSQQGMERNYANYNRDIIKGLIEEMITNGDCEEATKSQKLHDYAFEDIPDLIDLPELKSGQNLNHLHWNWKAYFTLQLSIGGDINVFQTLKLNG